MSDTKRILLARRARFIATALAGLGACAPVPPPHVDLAKSAGDAAAPLASKSAGDAGAPAVEILTTIPFPSLVATPSPAVAPLLDEIAAVLKERPSLVVEVRGHTDDKELEGVAFARANLVASSLAARGISRDRVIVTGLGKSEPRAPNATADGRAKNRRVDFRVREP